jgi:uncharacterized protein (TIGR02217 family)
MGFEGGSGYLTEIAQVPGGKEKRNAQRANSLGAWVATQLHKRHAPTQELIKYWHAAAGRANDFPFRDWTDYQVETGDGVFLALTASTYQLQKRYITGGVTRTRDIIRPLAGLVVTGSGTYSVSGSTGILTVTSGAAPTGWHGEFDLLCRFGTDDLKVTIVDKRGNGEFIYTWGDISIEEVRP